MMLPGKNQYVNIHAHRFSRNSGEWVLRSLKSIEYPSEENSSAVYSCGVHPWEISEVDVAHALKRIRVAAENSRVIAIGEIGIDRTIELSVDLQLRVFEAQVEFAVSEAMPVIIHAVKSYQELIHFARTTVPEVAMIIHGFRGNLQTAEMLIRFGYHLSFGAPLLNSPKVREVFSCLPPEKIFLETDESESSILDIYEAAAGLKGMSTDVLRDHMVENTYNIFRLKKGINKEDDEG
jgi:TatD DNase family protein